MAGPQIGGAALPFELADETGRTRRSEEFLGRPFVLYFYPADFTPGCTREACDFRDAFAEFRDLGVEVIGVSRDPPPKHAAFKIRYRLPFTLLSDVDGRVARAYGATGVLGRRTTFVVGADGRIAERIASLLPGPHVRKALDALGTTEEARP